jgi:hypothetical protein
MESNFSKVSLGFAEFVSQLIHETFDAILDSQNYQIEKYLELEKALNTSTAAFQSRYLTTEEINEHLLAEIGFELKPNMLLTEAQTAVLAAILSSIESKEIVKSKLTRAQYDAIYNHLIELLVAQKKAKIQMFVERPELARLFVDSGEIKAKLDLFCLNEEVKAPVKEAANPKLKKANIPLADKTAFEVKALDFSKMPIAGARTQVAAKEILDNTTGLKTILIDKESIKNKALNFNIPSTRIVANPINSSSTSSISSEVIIKFRSL